MMDDEKSFGPASLAGGFSESPVSLDATAPNRISMTQISTGCLSFSGDSPVVADAAAGSRNPYDTKIRFAPFEVLQADFARKAIGRGFVVGNLTFEKWASSHGGIIAASNGDSK
jgi:hypothetical protein